jgi:hypothetical protein
MTDDLLTTGETAEAAPAPASVAPRTEIEYVVLTRAEHNGPWIEASKRIKAKSPNDAIEAFIGPEGDPGNSNYVAIAARYWSPQSYGVEIETTRKLVPKAAK